MKTLVLVLFVAVLSVVFAADKYTTKYDNIDLNQILKSDRLLKNYVNCLLDRGKCSPDGQELKNNLADALQTSCSKCSQRQKDGSRTIIRYLIKNKRDWWNELEAKYDPTGIYKNKYADELKAEGIVL
ncbi:chemosensory protein 12 precursor [Tribolium castaneum]|uniref:Chemosensory protein 12 n=1 Tax=Tribolium castaneum TaxID=7070 RepID=Q0MRL1_TRICA|nr:chemosensory protein 12 precursor [Tribolium castaneum]ABH88185.1 chemosensory protein 12 [Tribolium castaneum]EFA07422.1 chemosensory protein 9 [Tribolium castaneum]|eukprot:NP_001039280.1 chemosensory protein 12 precursor [Tribolium castaneum]